MGTNPFVHRFRTSKGKYVYDVSSNNILKLDDHEYELVEKFSPTGPANLHLEFGEKFSSSAITAAWSRLKAAREDSAVFSGRVATGLRYQECDQHGFDSMQDRLGQLILSVTNRCNLRCRYCVFSGNYPNERSHDERQMSFDTAARAVEIFLRHSSKAERRFVSFYGGEPFLNFAVVKRVVESVDKRRLDGGCGFLIDTNGTILTPAIIEFLLGHNVYLQVSLDGPKDIHDLHRKYADGRPSYDKVMTSLSRLREADAYYFRTHVSIATTFSPPYDLLAVEEFFNEAAVGVCAFRVNFLNPEFENGELTFGETLTQNHLQEQMPILMQRYIDTKASSDRNIESPVLRDLFQNQLLRVHRRKVEPIPEFEHPNGACIPGQRRLFVDVDGRFFMCEKTGSSGCIGDIKSGVNWDKIRDLMNKYVSLSQEECKGCWAVRLCGLCYTSFLSGEELDVKRKRRYCEMERSSLETALVLYAEIMERNQHAFDYTAEMTII